MCNNFLYLRPNHWLINYVDTKAKCRHLKKLTCKGTLRQVFICLRFSPLRVFLGWSSNLVGSQSDQIQSVKLMQNMLSNRTPYPPPPHTHCMRIYGTVYLFTQERGEGGESWTREKIRGATVHRARSKIPTWPTVSPVYFLDDDILLWCLNM